MLKTHDKDLYLNAKDSRAMLEMITEKVATSCTILDNYKQTQITTATSIYANWKECHGPINKAFINMNNGVISWKKDMNEQENYSYIKLISFLENQSTKEVTQKLARKHKINPKRPMEHKTTVPFENDNLASEMARNAHASVDNEKASFGQLIVVSMPHGDAYYYVAIYKTTSGKAIHVPICQRLSDNRADITTITWGFCPENIPLAGLDMLEKFPKTRVLLVDDIWLADKINDLHGKTGNGTPDFVAVAIWAGTSRIPAYNFTPLWGRDVIFLPTLCKESIVAGEKLKEVLRPAGITSFKVLMTPVHGENWDLDACKSSCGEYAVEKAITTKSRDMLNLLDDLDTAWKFKRYKRFLEDDGFINQKSSAASSWFMSARDIEKSSDPASAAIPTMANIFAPSNISVIVGDSDAGKSLFARSLAIAICCGTAFCKFEKSKCRPVFIINAEQDLKKSRDYTKRSMAALNIPETPNNLYDTPLQSIEHPADMPAFDIIDKKWQHFLLEEITPDSVLIVDNLLSTSSKNVVSNSTAQEVRAFAGKLQRHGISLIIVHHTGDSGKYLGASGLKSLSQNFITLHVNEGPSNGGVNAKLTFIKIKSHPQLRGKEFTASLPYAEPDDQGGPWEFISNTGQDIQPEALTDSTTTEPKPSTPKPDGAGLSEIQQDALNIAYEKGQVTKKDLIDKGHKEGTVKDHLKELTEDGQLIKNGSGRGTFYTLPQTLN